MADEANKDAGAEPKKSKAMLFVILGVVVTIIVLIAVIALIFMGGDDKESEPLPSPTINTTSGQPNLDVQSMIENEVYKNPAAMYPLKKDIIANLKPSGIIDDSGNKTNGGYAKIMVTLILGDPNLAKEVALKEDIIYSRIIDILSNHTEEELEGAKNKAALRAEIVSQLNAVLQDGQIKAVVLPYFAVQSGY